MLIGIDLWAKIEITLEPPPRNRINQSTKTKMYSVGLSLQMSEEEQLKMFLDQFLDQEKFKSVKEPTNKIQRRIRL